MMVLHILAGWFLTAAIITIFTFFLTPIPYSWCMFIGFATMPTLTGIMLYFDLKQVKQKKLFNPS